MLGTHIDIGTESKVSIQSGAGLDAYKEESGELEDIRGRRGREFKSDLSIKLLQKEECSN